MPDMTSDLVWKFVVENVIGPTPQMTDAFEDTFGERPKIMKISHKDSETEPEPDSDQADRFIALKAPGALVLQIKGANGKLRRFRIDVSMTEIALKSRC